ncbi:hypothetical protein Tco_0126971 [Tanacetum coccineum]
MLDSYTSSMCLQSWGHMDYTRVLIDIRADLELKEDMIIDIPNMEDDGEVLHIMRVEYEWEPPRCEDDELGSNWGSSNSGKKFEQDVVGLTSGNPSNTPLVARINDLESQMIKGKLVLLDDDGKPLKPSKSMLLNSSNVVYKKVDDLVNEDNDNEVEEVYDETATYMASTSFTVYKASKSSSRGGNKSLYKQWQESHDEDAYDDDDVDDPGLTDAQMKFANAFDINLRDQLR